ncbi:hypothetical protein LOD99_12917 [Oopsacas minuta]|uniref:Receptor expression-enhancing protein n=1 Tax=Oopsacas minuta TaxID=111878 RepID=A0AAV7JAG6_9METZ|nr:hypothetical protein LOD99_12917 [Oopsacas minuta]
MFGLITDIITLFCCNLYPVFASFKAIRNRDGDEYSRWFIYWIMFSLFLSVTWVTDWIFWWIPFYGMLKLGISIWMLPFFRGSKILYTGLVHPQLMENEVQIDMFVNSISNRLLTLGKVLFSFALQKTTEAYATQTFAAVAPIPPQQPAAPQGMKYPLQTTESSPPTYSDVIGSDPGRQKEFSDDEDMAKHLSITLARVSPEPTDTTATSEPHMREPHRQTERPKSEAITQSQRSHLSRQKSPQFKTGRAQSEASIDLTSEKKRSSRQLRQQTQESTRQSKVQEK